MWCGCVCWSALDMRVQLVQLSEVHSRAKSRACILYWPWTITTIHGTLIIMEDPRRIVGHWELELCSTTTVTVFVFYNCPRIEYKMLECHTRTTSSAEKQKEWFDILFTVPAKM